MEISFKERLDRFESDKTTNGKCVYLNACELIASALKYAKELYGNSSQILCNYEAKYDEFQKAFPADAKTTRTNACKLIREILNFVG